MEATEECDDSSEKNEDVMFFNKLIVNINQISLDIAKTISCKFKFNCSLFSSESSRDRSSKSFQLNPEQAADYKVNTEGYTEYSNMMEHSNWRIFFIPIHWMLEFMMVKISLEHAKSTWM